MFLSGTLEGRGNIFRRIGETLTYFFFAQCSLLSSRFFEQVTPSSNADSSLAIRCQRFLQTAPQILRAVLHLKDVQRVAKRTGELKWFAKLRRDT